MSTNTHKPRIVLGMPGYGKQTSAAGRGFWRACADMSQVVNYYQNGSLLASNFNQLWCLALNMAHQGERIDYFAMLHDDVGPEDGWLDKLISELEAANLDVLSAVVPIKDNRGITSMALHRDSDNWLPLTRLSMHDVYELPETFTSEDIGHPLLLNTGCWVAKWNQDWCRKVHFEINDRIVFNAAANAFQAQTEPEDWHFSRQLHEIGTGPTANLPKLRIGATRKVALMHRGEIDFTNTRPWGRETFDSETVTRSPIANAFPHEIPGWLLPAEGKALAALATGKNVLEIGSYCGLSTVCMGRTAKHVTALDYFDGRGTPSPRETLSLFSANIARYDLTEKVVVCLPDQSLPLPEYDLVFIDGAHDAESVAADVDRALSVLADGGLLAFHDYQEPMHPGIAEAVSALVAQGGEILAIHDTLAVVRPPAAIPLEA